MPTSKRPLAPRLMPMSIQERDLLYKLYVKQNKTAQELADKFGMSERLVFTRLRQHGISKVGYKKRLPHYCPTCGQQVRQGKYR